MAAAVLTEEVSFPSGTRTLTGHLARPEAVGRAPGVVVIHEAWGLNADITRIVDDLAAEGYVALGADLFSASSTRPLCMARLISGMFINPLGHRGIHDLKASLDYLQQRPEVLCPVVGSYPENDFTAKHGRKLDRVLDGYAVEHDIKVYPATKHSFYRREDHYDPAAAQDSMSRVLAFFADHLGPSSRA